MINKICLTCSKLTICDDGNSDTEIRQRIDSIHVRPGDDDTNRETTGEGAGLWKQLGKKNCESW